MLVPTTQSTGTFSCSRTLSTPTWAPPFAPPPASTSPTRGRPAGARAGLAAGGTAFGGWLEKADGDAGEVSAAAVLEAGTA